MRYIAFLILAIAFEIVATSMLKVSDQFTRLVPTITSLLCYVASFYLLSLSLRAIPIGIAYAIWSGLGIVAISIIGYFAFKQSLDLPAILGIGMILAGVVVINVFSKI